MTELLDQARNFSWPFYVDSTPNWVTSKETLDEKNIQKVIYHAEQYKMFQATTAGNLLEEDIRRNKVVFLDPMCIEEIFQRITDVIHDINTKYFKFDITGIFEGLQFTEYNAPNDEYKAHVDRLYGNRNIRKLSFSIQLTDPKDYEGGDLEIILGHGRDIYKMPREKGSMIVFPSYVLHRVTPVTKGKRQSLVGWICGKPFK
jgi:PKHD-type hydroxylase